MDRSNTLVRFIAAAQAGHDEAAELLSDSLCAADEDGLLTLLYSPDQNLRWWAIRGLAQCGSEKAIDALATRLPDDDSAIRAAVLMALAQIHQRKIPLAQPLLLVMAERLADPSGLVRQVAADALAQCGEDAVAALTSVLARKHEGARTRAAYALHKIATLRVAPVLYHFLEDPNYLVRTHAYEALDEMGLLENVVVTI